MSRHNMLQQYDQAMRDCITKHRIVRQRFERIFKNDAADDDDDSATNNRKAFTMTRDETLRSILKRHNGITGLCKHIAATGDAIITEHELVSAATEEAKREHPDLTSELAFARTFTGPTGEPLRQAVETIKRAQPGIDGGRAARAAYRVLEKLADDERRRSPNLSSAQAFARVFRDHPELAEMAHRRPAPTTSYPFPR